MKDLRLIRYLVLFSFIAVGSHLCYSDNNANAGVAFNLGLVTVGKGSNWTSEKSGYPESSTKPFRLTATITPLSLASSITFSSDDQTIATVSVVSRTDGSDDQVVVLEVSGISQSDEETGDAKVQAKKGTKVVSEVPVVVVVPKTREHEVGPPLIINAAEAGDGRTVFMTWGGANVKITIKDQFGNTLSGIYNGEDVVEEEFYNRDPANLFPGEWVAIELADNVFEDGVKWDMVGGPSRSVIIWSFEDETAALEWETGELRIKAKYPPYDYVYDAFTYWGEEETLSADMKLRVVPGNFELTPEVHRKIEVDLDGESIVTVTDDIPES